MRILITGGAGFVGSSLALDAQARSRGSRGLRVRQPETPRQRVGARHGCKDGGVEFVHGDIRSADDLADRGSVRSAARMLGRALGACRLRRQSGLRAADQPDRHDHCLEAARRHVPTSSSSRPAACIRSIGFAALPLDRQRRRASTSPDDAARIGLVAQPASPPTFRSAATARCTAPRSSRPSSSSTNTGRCTASAPSSTAAA